MPKLARLTGPEAEALLLKAGYEMIRSSGSHRIYFRAGKRIVLPFHPGKVLHPKIVKQVVRFIEEVE
ncbi:MAG: addiction module toxin, HicA family [Deltaproteobacteria bacterium]|nr:addiction module toxin, HicA family [Deltaproteobacteria bacterium]